MPSKEGDPDPVGHEEPVTCLVISHDSTRAVTSSFDGTIIVWDMVGAAVLHEWMVHQGSSVKALALSPDSRRLVSAGGGALTVWGIDSDAVLKAATLEGHIDTVTTCTWSPDGALIASASLDGIVCIWDGHTYQQRDLLPEYPYSRLSWEPQSLRFSPDARCLAWMSSGKMCCIWRPLMGDQLKVLRPHPDCGGVCTIMFSFDHESRRIATAHGNGNGDPDPNVQCEVVRIWDAATGAPIAVLRVTGHSNTVWSALFSQDGRSLLSIDNNMSMHIWDCGTWSEKQTPGMLKDAASLTWQWWQCVRLDGKYVAAGPHQGLVRLWRTRDGACIATLDSGPDYIMTCFEFSPNGQFLVSGNMAGMIRIHCISKFVGE